MALAIDASALLIYRAAWTKDVLGGRVTLEAAEQVSVRGPTAASLGSGDSPVSHTGFAGELIALSVARMWNESPPDGTMAVSGTGSEAA